MSHLPRRLAVGALTILAMGAGAAPALAAAKTPLVKTIDQLHGGLYLTIDENLHTATGDRRAIHLLIANAYAIDQATKVVAPIPAAADQQAGKAEWLSGERLQVNDDIRIAAALFMILHGHTTAGWQELQALTAEDNRVDTVTSKADRALGAE